MKGSTMKPIKKIIALLSAPIFICTPDLKSQVKGSTISIIPQFGFEEHRMSYILTDRIALYRGLFAAAPADLFNVSGNTVGVYAAYTPKMNSYLTVSFRGGYTRHFTSTFTLSLNGNSKVFREVKYAFNEFSIEPLAVFKVWKNLNIIGGTRLGIVNREYFTIKSQVVTGTYRFNNDETSEIRESNGLPEDNPLINSISIGLSYDFELSDDYYVSPEIIASFNASQYFSGFDTQGMPIRAGLSVKHVLNE